jgi:predicted amidophosphoribosyltransferase
MPLNIQGLPRRAASDMCRDACTGETPLSAPGGAAIVLVDDVLRSGTTLAACSMAIRVAGDGRPLFAVVVAKRRSEPADP